MKHIEERVCMSTSLEWSGENAPGTLYKNHGFSMISILRVRVDCGANTKETIKQQSRNRTCIYEGLEVDFSAS